VCWVGGVTNCLHSHIKGVHLARAVECHYGQPRIKTLHRDPSRARKQPALAQNLIRKGPPDEPPCCHFYAQRKINQHKYPEDEGEDDVKTIHPDDSERPTQTAGCGGIMMGDELPMMERLRLADEEAEALANQHPPSSRAGQPIESHHGVEEQLRATTAEILAKDQQVKRLMEEIDEILRRERSNADRSSKAVALCEAKASASRRHVLELKAYVSCHSQPPPHCQRACEHGSPITRFVCAYP